MANRLNIPNKDDKFAEVDFVKLMTPYQLKILIKNMWENLGELADETDEVRPDISHIIDTMRDGGRWNKKQVRQRYRCVYMNGIIVQYDSKRDQFIFMDRDGNVDERDAMNIKDLQKVITKTH